MQAMPICVYSDQPCTRFLCWSCSPCYLLASLLPKTLLDGRYQYTLPVVVALILFLPYFFPLSILPCIYLQIVKYLLFEHGVDALWWSLCTFMYLVLTCMSGESYRRRLSSLLLCLCDVFRLLINSLVCLFFHVFMGSEHQVTSQLSLFPFLSL